MTRARPPGRGHSSGPVAATPPGRPLKARSPQPAPQGPAAAIVARLSRPEPTPRVVFEDPSLPHQIVIRKTQHGSGVAVSCNCLRNSGAAIEIRARWTTAEAIAAWRAHLGSGGEAW